MKSKQYFFHQLNLLKVLKIALGALIASFLAEWLSIAYSTSAGVITILSIQNTKRETLLVVGKRIGAFFLACFLAYVSFSLLGYNVMAIGLFLLLFALVCNLFSLQDALVMDTVLMLHFYAEQSMSFAWIKNELFLLFIGTGVGVLMNAYMPGNVKIIRENQRELEVTIREILHQMSALIRKKDKDCLEEVLELLKMLNDKLNNMAIWAYEEHDNTLMSDNRYFIKYVELRKNQSFVLKKLYKNIHLLDTVPTQAILVADYIETISQTFHEHNNGEKLKRQLELIQEKMKGELLPTTRTEFENRAILYRILYDLEEFLQLKIQFVTALTEKEIQRFWK